MGRFGSAQLGSRIPIRSLYGDFSSGTASPMLPGELPVAGAEGPGDPGRPGGREELPAPSPWGNPSASSPEQPPGEVAPALESPWMQCPWGPPNTRASPTLSHGTGGVPLGCWAGVPDPLASWGWSGGLLICPQLHTGMGEPTCFPPSCRDVLQCTAMRDPPGSSPPSRIVFLSPFGGFHLPSNFSFFFFPPSFFWNRFSCSANC